MPKRQRGERDGGSTAERRRHLYLVVDDWECGYSIRKVRLPLPCTSDEHAEQRLPKPFWRYEADRQFPQFFTSAFGTKIMGLHHNNSCIVQLVDVRARTVVLGPRTNCPAFPIYFSVGSDKLFAIDAACFELCRLPLVHPDAESDSDGSSPDESESESDSDSDSNDKWSWRQLPEPPFPTTDVSSYAMHSDGQSILVSVKGEETETVATTFIFDMGKFVWECLGEWMLPFTGRGHFDRELKALVGLSKDPEAFGCLYACNVPNTGDRHCPAWKCSKEKVFSKHPADRHVSASLVYMENWRKYCLVECVWVEKESACQVKVKEDKADQVLLEKSEGVGGVPQRGRHMYRLMTFSLKYDKMHDLRVKCRRVRYYEVPNTVSAESIRMDPVAFWL
ncbi:hypothetical protein GQ55_4G005100 [Panicum hallii var. hallii]|uniref:DUF1618 domain-containing protein n=1 Tax=Panicum hallii var. hallii TaxID=1504633 RepID=A0A2T7DTS1_9POAL|nr:hypothetical protein GQ55_4G005100 [Panicum hallii var. hallii]